MLDYEIGRLLDYLEEHDLSRNTIVVLSADHGDMMTGSHGGMMDKGCSMKKPITFLSLSHGRAL